jgi:hypothetical protein
MAGALSLRNRVEEARARRDEASEGFLSRVAKQQEPKVQGPARPIERPRLSQPSRTQVEHTSPERPYTATPEIDSQLVGRPVYNPEDSYPSYQESNTVGYMEPRRREEDNRPPRPNVMPEVTPVAALKNRTALNNRLTPEAAQDLYDTPVRVNYSQSDSPVRGWYENRYPVESFVREKAGWDDPFRIHVTQATNDEQAQKSLMHEYAHKWHKENMPMGMYEAWNTMSPVMATDHAKERVSTDYQGTLYPGMELYATATEQGPWGIPEDLRRNYYPFYREDIGAPPIPQEAMVAQIEPLPGPDLKKLREQYFSPQYWVPENYARWGYYADGTSRPPPVWDFKGENGWPAAGIMSGPGRG